MKSLSLIGDAGGGVMICASGREMAQAYWKGVIGLSVDAVGLSGVPIF